MMMRALFFLCLLLPLGATQISTVTRAGSDQTCARNLKNNLVCCPSLCPKCGGRGCAEGGLGKSCCTASVKKSARSCRHFDPPCIIDTSGSLRGRDEGTGGTHSPPAVASGTWQNIDRSVTGRPRARHEACFVMANGKAYLLGGRGDRGLDIFDPRTRRWSRGTGMPTQMHHMQCVVWQGGIYIASSWFGPSPTETVNPLLWVYDTARDSWSSRPGLPRARRRGAAAAVVHDDKIWVVGGNVGGHGPPARTLGWMDYYDLRRRRWVTNLPGLPQPRDHVGAAVVRGQLCVAGGRDGGARNFFAATVRSTYCYNFGAKRWRNMNAPLPEGRAGAATATTCDGKMMVAGGEARFSAAFSRVDLFDGVRWTRGPDLVRARHGTGLAVAQCGCGLVFIASGSGARGGRPELDSTEVLIPAGRSGTCTRY